MVNVFEQFFNTDKLGEVVILSCFDRLEDFKRIYTKNILCEFKGYYSGITINLEGRHISVIYTGSGDSKVGDAVLALDGSRCKAIIYNGTAGGVGNRVARGEFFIPREAVIGEGFSTYYKDMKPDRYKNISFASPDMLKMFEEYASTSKNLKTRAHYSKIFTIDSIFAETQEFLAEMQLNGCEAIDMETSAFYTAAQVIKKKCLAVHYISDLPQEEQNYNMFRKECIKSYIRIPYLLIEFIYTFFNEIINIGGLKPNV